MLDDAILERLRAAAGEDGVSVRPADLDAASSDHWPRLNVLRLSRSAPDWRPEAVAWPADEAALAGVLRTCHEAGIPVVPRGGGTGVCGGAVPVEGGVVLDLTRMARVLEVDDLTMTVRVEAGCTGQALEEALSARGYTLGHAPTSSEQSTVGGWVSTRSAGPHSARYGKIEDLAVGLDVVLADGTPLSLDATRSHSGAPDLVQAFLGGEGTLGVVVRARLRIFPKPQALRLAGFRFLDLEMGLEAMRSILQAGLRPGVLRLSDPLATLLEDFAAGEEGGLDPLEEGAGPLEGLLRRLVRGELPRMSADVSARLLRRVLTWPSLARPVMERLPLSSLLVVGFEGHERRTRFDLAEATDLALRANGRQLAQAPDVQRMHERHGAPRMLRQIFGRGAFADTVEVSGRWSDLVHIYRKTTEALTGRVAVMASFSHAYREGCACYFTALGGQQDPRRLLELYDWCIPEGLTRAMAAGASVSHHHGIGMMKRAYTPEEYRGGSRLFWALKRALDPACVMNPQKVYPATVPLLRQPESRHGPEDFATGLQWDHPATPPSEVAPEVPEELPEVLALARREGWVLSCQGGEGTGPRRQKGEKRPVRVSLDRLDQVVEMDPVSGTVTVQAGLTVLQVENYLRERGHTLGFVPRRLLALPVGDYLSQASPAAGSPKYGTVRDNCIGLSAVMADGTPFSVRPAPRRSAGPDLMHCFVGARGQFGIITAACFRVFPLPAVRDSVAFGARDAVDALAAVRTILVREALPEWVLLVFRAPSAASNRNPVRVVLQLGGTRSQVSADLEIVREVMEPMGLEPEPIRTEDRLQPPPRRWPYVEGFLSMDRLMEAARDLRRVDPATRPEVHVTHLSVQGATLRLLLREEGQRFPPDLEAILRERDAGPDLLRAARMLKAELDPSGILNPGRA